MAQGARRLRRLIGGLSSIPSTNPEDALEPALRAVLGASGAVAGAVCLYDASEGVLRLVLEVGLSDEGCRRLRRISLSDPEAWIAPLQGLLARRRRTLERSSGATIPPLLEPAESITTVVCIPLHAEGRPRASLVLVGIGAAQLDPGTLRDADAAVTNITRVVEAIGRRGRAASVVEPVMMGPAAIVAPATRQRLESLADPAPVAGHDPGALPAADFSVLLTESDELIDDRETLDRAHAAEVEHLTVRLTESERAWAREHSLRVEQELRYERARIRAETERNETVRRAREFVETAERLRSAAVAEVESVRAALAQARRLGLEARNVAQRSQAEAEAARAAESAARAKHDQLTKALEEARASATGLASERLQLEAELAALKRQEAAARAHEADIDARWQAKLADAERALEQERRRDTGREAERLSLIGQLEEAVARENHLRAEIEAVVERSSAEHEEMLRRALEIERTAEASRTAANAELEALRTALGEAQRLILDAEDRPPDGGRLRHVEQARAAAVLELERTRHALAAAQAEILSARADVGRLREEAHRLASERETARDEGGRLASALEEARSRLTESTVGAARLQAELHALRERVTRSEADARTREDEAEARWLARLGELEVVAAGARARVTDLETDIARHAQELADARAAEAHAREVVRIVTEDREGVLARITELARTAEEARASAVSEAEAIRAALGNAQALIIQAEHDACQARGEVERQEAELRAVESDREQLRRALETARAAGELPRDSARTPRHASRSSSAAPATVATAPAEPTRTTPASGREVVAVVGGDDAFAASSPDGVEVNVLTSGLGLDTRLAQLMPTCVLVNLASAGALDVVASLRAAGCTTPVWGCLAVSGADGILPLGRIETTSRSLETEAVLAVLGPHAMRGTRLLAVGTMPDGLLSLRQTLSRAGLSMSIAWDTNQARDLLSMVRPDVVIVDLELPSQGGYRIVADIALIEPRPLAVLVPPAGDDPAAAFAAVFAERYRRGAVLSHARSLQAIVTASGAATRRQ